MTTYFNTKDGVIISQTDGESTWYFQYDTNGSPLGFVLNGIQYFYITNQMGDILAITDAEGSIVGNYEYDAWGKVLTADTDIAKQNPLRYRGYYYDSETGYYYLQSRYYDSDICRFINSDSHKYIGCDIPCEVNLYVYCCNNSINNLDITGYTYSPSKAQSYADKWWNGRNVYQYKTNEKDCANFVSQCLFAGKLSGMTDEWYHRIYHYNKVYVGGPVPYKYYASIGKISAAWGIAIELGKWLYKNFSNRQNGKFNYVTDLKSLNNIGKKLYKKPICSAVILLEWHTGKKVNYHIMMSGKIKKKNGTYYIYTYGHTNDRNGKVTNDKFISMQGFLRDNSKSKKIIRVYFLI